MNSVMEEALGTIALHAQEYAIVAEQAGDPNGAAAFAAIADMLAGIAENRGSPLLTVAEGRKINGKDHAHHAQTEHALAIAAEGMRMGMDRATALKAAEMATGRTQKALQGLNVIPADRVAFHVWYSSPDGARIKGVAVAAKAVLGRLLEREPTFDEFAKHVGGVASHYGVAASGSKTTIDVIQRLFKSAPGAGFFRAIDALGGGLQMRLKAMLGQ